MTAPASAIDTGFEPSLVTLNANTGNYIILVGTRLSKAIEIIEDASANSGTAQGLQYLLPDPTNPPGCSYPAASGIAANPGAWIGANGSSTVLSSATVGFAIAPQSEPIVLGDRYAIHAPHGPSVANGPNMLLGVGATGGTPYIAIRSNSASATKIRVTEFS